MTDAQLAQHLDNISECLEGVRTLLVKGDLQLASTEIVRMGKYMNTVNRVLEIEKDGTSNTVTITHYTLA